MSEERRLSHLKIAAGIMIIVMLFVVLFSSFYIAVESNHDCSGDNCPICMVVQHCENTLHQLVSGAPYLIGAFFAILLFSIIVPILSKAQVFQTLVSMKVRLND